MRLAAQSRSAVGAIPHSSRAQDGSPLGPAAMRSARPAAARQRPGARSGSVTTLRSSRVRRRQCGIAIASTKCSWKRGSIAVSIFSIAAHERLDRRARALIEQRDARAGAGGVAGRAHLVERAVGDHAEHHGVLDVDVAAERAGQPDAVDVLDAEPVHQQAHAGIERRLGELDRAHVVLRDAERRAAVAACAAA